MRLLPIQIRMGNQRAGLAQPKAPLPEQTLALAHPQVHLEALLDPGAQRFPVPQGTGQTQVARRLAQGSVHLPQLCLVEAPRTPRALPLSQSGQALHLEAAEPQPVTQGPAALASAEPLRPYIERFGALTLGHSVVRLCVFYEFC